MSKETNSAVADIPASPVQKAEGGKPKAEAAPDVVVRLPIDQFRPSPTNPRKHFDEAKLKELGESLKIKQIHNVMARRVPGKEGVELIVGECRWRAGTMVGLTHLNVVIVDIDDVQVLKLQIAENAQRKDITAIEEANAINELMKRGKLTVADVAKDTGLEVRTIYLRLELLKMSPAIRAELEAGILTPKHAELIGRLPEAAQADALATCIQEAYLPSQKLDHSERRVKVAIPVSDLQRWISIEIYRDLTAVPWKKDDAELCPKAGACSVCPKRTGANPLAFPDAKKDSCLDDSCFHQKMNAHIEARIKEGAVPITSSNYGRDGVKNRNEYSESKAANAVAGIFVEHERRGQEIKIKLTAKVAEEIKKETEKKEVIAKAKAPTASKEDRAAAEKLREEEHKRRERENAQREAAEEKQRKENDRKKYQYTVRQRVFKVIIGKIKAVGRIELEELAAGAAHNIDSETAELLEWPKGYGFKNLDKLSEGQLAQIIIADLLGNELSMWSDGKVISETAKRYKVDSAAIEKELKAELAAQAASAETADIKLCVRNKVTGEICPRNKTYSGPDWINGYLDAEAEFHVGEPKISGKQIKANIAAAKGKKPKAKKKK